MLVMEHIPDALGSSVTQAVKIPTIGIGIGIGAGPCCDGQVLVINDAIGMGDRWPPFSRPYAYTGKTIISSAEMFISQVTSRTLVDQVRKLG